MATTGTPGTAASSLPAGGGTSTAGLADWASPYITNYLGRAQALGEMPYQTYQGPLTAGPSDIQNKVFQGIGNLTFPSNLGRSFASPMGGAMGGAMGVTGGNPAPDYGLMIQRPEFMGGGNYANSGTPDFGTLGGTGKYDPATGQYDLGTAGNMGGMPPYAAMGMGPVPQTEEMRNMARQLDHSDYPMGSSTNQGGIAGLQPPQASMQPSNIAQSYMNPYLQQALDPQLRELQRQSDIQRVQDAGRLTQAGAFGGGRQAIMESEGRRNLLGKQADVLGTGYATAYDKAMQQFNAEQGQSRDLAKLMTDIGGIQRGITSEGVTADLNEFNVQRDFPYKQLQFQRDMISGLPTGSVTNTPAQLSGVAQLIASAGGIDKLLKSTGQSDLGDLLGKLGLNLGGGELV